MANLINIQPMKAQSWHGV